MTQINCIDELSKAQTLLSNVKHNIMFQPKSTEKIIKLDLAELKAIIDEAHFLFNSETMTDEYPHLLNPTKATV